MNTLQRQARLFRLVRATATPGSRVLAEGAEWSDGAVALRWLDRWPNTSTWPDLDSLLAAHTTTQLLWLAPPPVPAAPVPPATVPVASAAAPPVASSAAPPVATPAVPAAAPETQPRTVWLPAPAPDGRCSRCGRPWPCLDCGP